ncbi:AraC-type DNA-binding protein [Arachidicoccus rhizosphaerae]|uniref:AraC-type DNA-binding protein n=1 Tax=Arachidicoccus rhizosphaerae TaxID=551991 RepID=A0A1H3YW50_9BACT|nr:AraC family transcriptional regulator [Arachidicoccus rhizosphaerae]SEA15421.1 AraC-type DNA-binding protein [Arachidicoccus rhizosphaerae]
MQDSKEILQHKGGESGLGVRISSDDNHHLTEKEYQLLLRPHRMRFFFLVFVQTGSLTYTVDMNKMDVSDNQLLFVLPNQIFTPPASAPSDSRYFKMGFDEKTLALLPETFAFLMTPDAGQKVQFDPEQGTRLVTIFQTLNKLLYSTAQVAPEIILAHLNVLLTEINCTYATSRPNLRAGNAKWSKYIAFKLAVENNLSAENSVQEVAQQLAVSTNRLYGIVKGFSGLSPKEFMIHRLMTEAGRRLRYSGTSVKEVAYELGFNDPDYFSRLFKKNTGRSISEFLSEK